MPVLVWRVICEPGYHFLLLTIQLSVGNISNAHRTDMLEALDACVQEK